MSRDDLDETDLRRVLSLPNSALTLSGPVEAPRPHDHVYDLMAICQECGNGVVIEENWDGVR